MLIFNLNHSSTIKFIKMRSIKSILLFHFLLIILTINVYSQKSDSIDTKEEITAISVTNIPIELEKASSLLSLEENNLKDSKRIEKANTNYDQLNQKYKELRSVIDELELKQQASTKIKELMRKWEVFQNNISTLLNDITDQTAALQVQKVKNKKLLNLWEVTKSNASKAKIPTDLIYAIEKLQTNIKNVDSLLSDELNSLLLIQSNLSKMAIEVDNVFVKIKEIDDTNRRNILTRNASPIWQMGSDTTQTKPLTQELEDIIHSYISGYNESRELYVDEIPLYTLLFIIFFIFVIYLKTNSKDINTEEEVMQRALTLLNYPLSATILIFGIFLTLSFGDAPAAMQSMIRILLLIPLVRITAKLVNPTIVKLVYIFSILFFINQIKIAASSATSLERLLLLALTIFSMGGVFWLIQTKQISEHLYSLKQKDYVQLVRKIVLALFSLSLIANIFGYVKLGIVLLNGVYDVLFFTFILVSGVYILRAILMVFLQTNFGKNFRVVQYQANTIKNTLEKIIRITIKIIWVIIALSAFSLYEPTKDWFVEFLEADIGFGSFSITLGDILLFIVTVWVSILLSRFIRFILDGDILPRLSLPRGVPGTISILTKYLILGFGFIIAITSVGLDLNKFTILIGALGVGIGFGLQDLVNNFISGLILIFERPIQIGDVVHFSQIEGRVTNIGIRSSTIKTWQGAEIIVPNGHLVSNDVINWTLSDKRRRIELAVGVKYGSNVELVTKILLDCAKSDDRILLDPLPAVMFKAFGDNSLNFELRCWTGNFDEWFIISSEMHYAVNKAFKENNITIPFPQRDIHIKSNEENEFLDQQTKEDKSEEDK